MYFWIAVVMRKTRFARKPERTLGYSAVGLRPVAGPITGYLAEWEYELSHNAWLESPAGRQWTARQEAEAEAARRQQMLRNWDKR